MSARRLSHHRRVDRPAPLAPRHRRRADGGAALLELALALGVLAVLLFGIITFGITLSYKQSLSQAANEAARAAAVAPAGLAGARAEAAANRAIDGYDTPCNDASKGLTCSFVIAKCSGTTGPDCMTVRLTYALREHPRVTSVPGVDAALPATLVSTAVVELNSA